ncbi:hypothetical protein VHEMI07399 [[Torrubiella] hemipterigena]|uniref:Zn(2)-C6 fungal-type domain-containing protein n=1 Tax=[Torrubiella] hemipterigena TaxID=1531966 RepID=A0A0A1T3H7_9HYPO|nr:hypothetical protein VHEMI07399 [[Torrubiella] hemipterigena]
MSQLQHRPFLSKEIGSCQKKRARKACSGCRARKVRCDVLIVGHPCTQCRDNEFECIVKERKKRQMKAMVSFKEKRDSADFVPSMPEHTMLHQVPFYSFFKTFARLGRGTQQVAAGNMQQSEVALPISLREPCTNSTGDDLEIEFLKHKGVFTLPPKHILDECIAAYFRIFHSFFPIVDKVDFFNAYEGVNHDDRPLERQGPSLLLLQAVLFTAASFLPMEKIREMGFNTRQHARSTYHQRARYLYEFNYEPNIITNIQALLLMSHYYTSMVEQKHTWFWAHQAISLAQGAGLHHQSARQPKRKLWTRIWWGCVVRDRLIALGTGRPMHIISLDCTVPILTAADLAEAGDSEEDCAVKQVFIEFTKLCQHIEGVLLLSSTDEGLVQGQHKVCEAALQGWLHDLPQVARRDSTAQTCTGETPVLYRNILYLILK